MLLQNKVKIHFSLMCVMFSLLIKSSLLWAGCNKELINGWGENWPPFITGSYDKPSGLDMEILDAVVKTAGCSWKNTKSEIPWVRHMTWIKSGKLDLATAVTWTQERSEFAYFSKPYRNEYVAIFIRQTDAEKYAELSLQELSLSSFKVGSERGNTYGEAMDSVLKKMGEQVEYVTSDEQNILKLQGKRIDGYLGYIPSSAMLIKEQGLEQDIIALPQSLVSTGAVHIILSKKNNSLEIFKALDTALVEIKSNGIYDKIIKKYSEEYGVFYW